MKKILAFLLILTSCQPLHIVLDDQTVKPVSRAIGWQDMNAKYNYRDTTKFDVLSEFEDGARIGDYKTGSAVTNIDSITDNGTSFYLYKGATILAASHSGQGVYNVLDYGADPTGATESTTAIQNALNDANGSIVYIPAGYYVTGTLVIGDDSTTIMGAGRYNTILKLKDAADAGTSWGNLIYCGGPDNFTLKDIQLDGNGLNQTKVDNRAGTNRSKSIGVCMNDTTGTVTTNKWRVENCYIHDFARNAVVWSLGTDGVVTGCYFKNNFVAQVEFWERTKNGRIENCDMRNGTGISLYGDNHTVSDCKFEYLYNANMWDAYDFGISLEAVAPGFGPDNVKISDCIIKGDTMTYGIFSATAGMQNLSLDNNTIISSDPDHYAIMMVKDTNTLITNNHIIGTKYGITLNGAIKGTVSNNFITGAALMGIQLGGDADNNIIIGNSIIKTAGYPIYINSGATGNKAANNLLSGAWAGGDISNSGTNTISFNNYSVIYGSMLPNIVSNNIEYTATSDGTGTGIISNGSGNITVVSTNAIYICCLPAASTATIGTVITGKVGANGFELRVAASQAATVQLNGVTTNVEAAIPASTNFKVTQVDDNDWILECTTNLGAVLTARIPDAI